MFSKLAEDIEKKTNEKLTSPSYIKSLVGGVDPTGLLTFQVGQDEENRSRDKWHKLLGITGGVLGGAALIPGIGGAGVGIYENLPKILAAKGWKGRLKELGSQMWKGAILPFSSMRHWARTSRGIEDMISKGEATPSELAKISDAMGLNIEDAARILKKTKMGPNIKGTSFTPSFNEMWKANKNNKINLKDSGLGEALTGLNTKAKSSLNNIIAGVGLSGSIGGAAAMGQYNSGRSSGIDIRRNKARADSANSELSKVRKELEKTKANQNIYNLPKDWKAPKGWENSGKFVRN